MHLLCRAALCSATLALPMVHAATETVSLDDPVAVLALRAPAPQAGEHVFVEAFGAQCDGSTDDSQAIQAANDHAALRHDETGIRVAVNYPAGKTCIVAHVYIFADQLGHGATLRLPADANSWMFSIAAPEITISGIRFDGNGQAQFQCSQEHVEQAVNQCDEVPSRFNSNYQGLSKFSLIQAPMLFRTLTVENNVFLDTYHGAMALIDQTEGCAVGHCTAEMGSGHGPTLISEVVIRGNDFRDLGTMAVHALNPYESRLVDLGSNYLNGTFIFEDNVAERIGTTDFAHWDGATEHGNALMAGGFRNVSISGNRFEDVARVAVKLGANNRIVVRKNAILDARWGGLQIQTFPLDEEATELPGHILVASNEFRSRFRPGKFVLLHGSSKTTNNHTVYPRVDIRDNHMQHVGMVPGQLDAIELTGQAKYRRVHVVGNTFDQLGRAAVNFVQSTADEFRVELLELSDNLMRGGQLTWANGLFLSQGSGLPMRHLVIENNTTIGVTTPYSQEAAAADHLVLRNNRFRESRGTWNVFFADCRRLDYLEASGNEFDSLVDHIEANDTVFERNQCVNATSCLYHAPPDHPNRVNNPCK